MRNSKPSYEVELISSLLAISFTARNLADKIIENSDEKGEIENVKNCSNCKNRTICKGSCR